MYMFEYTLYPQMHSQIIEFLSQISATGYELVVTYTLACDASLITQRLTRDFIVE